MGTAIVYIVLRTCDEHVLIGAACAVMFVVYIQQGALSSWCLWMVCTVVVWNQLGHRVASGSSVFSQCTWLIGSKSYIWKW